MKNTDDHSTYSVAVAVEKVLSFLIPANECIESTCLEFFGDGDDLKSGCFFNRVMSSCD